MLGSSLQTKAMAFYLTFSANALGEAFCTHDWTTRCDLCKDTIQFSTEATQGNTNTCLECRGYFCMRCCPGGKCWECSTYD